MPRTMSEPLEGLWRFPELAVRLHWAGDVDPRLRARLVARGLAQRNTPSSAIETLLREGEFAVAADMLDDLARSEVVPEAVADGLARRLAAAQDAARDLITAEAQVLRNRAERADLEDLDTEAVKDDSQIRLVDARAHLAALAQRIDEVERARIAEIERALHDTVGSRGSPADNAWAAQIRALLSAKELRAARQVLAEGPGASSKLPVAEPVATWPWRSYQVDEVLGWFGLSRRFAPVGFDDYVLDPAGEKLVQAMSNPGTVRHSSKRSRS